MMCYLGEAKTFFSREKKVFAFPQAPHHFPLVTAQCNEDGRKAEYFFASRWSAMRLFLHIVVLSQISHYAFLCLTSQTCQTRPTEKQLPSN